MQTVTVPMESLAEIISLQLDTGGKANLTVTGSSMLPMLHDRKDSVTLVPADGKQQKGDVILYRRENGRYILHRIIDADQDGYICCGDNQAVKEPVSRERVIAVVDGFTRKGRVYTTAAAGYRLYTALWVGLFPLRPYYIKLRRRIGRLRRKIQKKS